MKIINKQKFLAELGRLLTFMFEEDRQTALAMYNRLFDSADNEQAVLQFLVSPTRQAVILARAYDSGERKLQTHSEYRGDDNPLPDGEIPVFVRAIENIERDALSGGIISSPSDENQFSLFDSQEPVDAGLLPDDELARPDDELARLDDELAQPESIEPLPDGTDGAEGEAAEGEAAEAVQDDSQLMMPGFPEAAQDELSLPQLSESGADAEENSAPAEEAEMPEDAAVNGDAVASEAAEAGGDPIDAVDKFLADFSIANDELAVKDEKAPEQEERSEAPAPAEAKEDAPAAAGPAAGNSPSAANAVVPAVDSADPVKDDFSTLPPVASARKTNPFLLVLYLIFAIPVGLAGLFILLIPTLLFLALSVSVLTVGIMLLTSFGGLVMFSDILLLLGASLVVLALGLLCALVFIWFIMGAAVGFIRGLCRIGGKLCTREVAEE